MRAIIQRVSSASVSVAGEEVAVIGPGLLVLVGVHRDDGEAEADRLAAKIRALRLFADASGRMNLSLDEVGAEVLCISQFTLYGDVSRGNRPSYTDAAPAERARPLYERVAERLGAATGRFGESMQVALVNDGPVTLGIEA